LSRIKNYTGISAPYDPPRNNPDLEINTGTEPLNDCVKVVIDLLKNRGIII